MQLLEHGLFRPMLQNCKLGCNHQSMVCSKLCCNAVGWGLDVIALLFIFSDSFCMDSIFTKWCILHCSPNLGTLVWKRVTRHYFFWFDNVLGVFLLLTMFSDYLFKFLFSLLVYLKLLGLWALTFKYIISCWNLC